MLKDVSRLISARDVVYYAGDQLYRRSLRYTALTAAISLLGYLGNYLPGIDTYNAKVAIALPLIVGSSMLLSGFLLKTIPALMSVRAMNVAEAQDLDLMEDYRKWHEKHHLAVLWERVYRFEWAVGAASSRVVEHPDEAPPDVCLVDLKEEDPEARGWLQFYSRARFALARPQPQPRQRYYLGMDLRFFEDWRNGAFFDREDVKLTEQFDASATLEAVKREVGYEHRAVLHDLPIRWHQRLWHFLITRAVAVRVGDTITWLNDRFDTDYFNAQVLLWPGEEREAWVRQFPRAGDDLRQRRRLIVARVFGEDPAGAHRVLRRMLWPTCWLAAKVRAAYDPEYVEGSLGYDVAADLDEIHIAPKRIARYRELARQVQADRAALVPWLERFRPELLTAQHAEAFRAVRIAVHIARRRLRPFLHASPQDPKKAEAFADHVLEVIDQAARRRARYSSRLVGIRMHHELTRLHYREYLKLLDRLGEPDQPE
jgi:hypothetical protein